MAVLNIRDEHEKMMLKLHVLQCWTNEIHNMIIQEHKLKVNSIIHLATVPLYCNVALARIISSSLEYLDRVKSVASLELDAIL